MLRGMTTKNSSTKPIVKGIEPTSSANENVAALVRLLARQAARELLSTHPQKENTDVDGKV